MQKQGEILMILVRRSDVEAQDIAAEMDIDPSYLSRLYHKSVLPKSIIAKACSFFGVTPDYFNETIDISAENPRSKKVYTESDIAKMESTIEELRMDLQREKKMTSELSEALSNITKLKSI